jgi:hypothetical protein
MRDGTVIHVCVEGSIVSQIAPYDTTWRAYWLKLSLRDGEAARIVAELQEKGRATHGIATLTLDPEAHVDLVIEAARDLWPEPFATPHLDLTKRIILGERARERERSGDRDLMFADTSADRPWRVRAEGARR